MLQHERTSPPYGASQDTRYEGAFIVGAACAERATTAALVMLPANAQAMDLHLREIAKVVATGSQGSWYCTRRIPAFVFAGMTKS